MNAENLDREFDEGEDITDLLDLEAAARPGLKRSSGSNWAMRLLGLLGLFALLWAFNDMARIREWLWATQDLASEVGGMVENEAEAAADAAPEVGSTGIPNPNAHPIYTADEAISVTHRIASQYLLTNREDGSVREAIFSIRSAEARLLTLGQYIESEGLGWYTDDNPKKEYLESLEHVYLQESLIWIVLLELSEDGEGKPKTWVGVWSATDGGLFDQGERPRVLLEDLRRLKPSKKKVAHATAIPTWTPFPTRTPGPAATLNAFERGEVERMEALQESGRIEDLFVRKIRGTDAKNFEAFQGGGSSLEPTGFKLLVYFKTRDMGDDLIPGWSHLDRDPFADSRTPPAPTATRVPLSERPLKTYYFSIRTDENEPPYDGTSGFGSSSNENMQEEMDWLLAYPAPE